MKIKRFNLIVGIIFLIFTALFSACKSEPDYTTEYHIINNSNYSLSLHKYLMNEKDIIEIENNEDYAYTIQGATTIAEPFDYYMNDSIVVVFENGKRLVYHPYADNKNIFDTFYYESSEINTNKDRYYHFVYKYYITPEDYGLAE